MVIYVRFLPDSRAVAAVGRFQGLVAEDFSHALASVAALGSFSPGLGSKNRKLRTHIMYHKHES